MDIKINANRMNLLKLRRRLKFALRGHKLLKDKQEQLTREFNKLIIELTKLREEIELTLLDVYRNLQKVYSNYPLELVEQWCDLYFQKEGYKISFERRTKFNLKYDVVIAEKQSDNEIEGFVTTDIYFNLAMKKFTTLFFKLVELYNLEHLCELMAKELQTTRRRVNALEYVLIPRIKYGIKFILNKLNELERTNITQLMRIKQLMSEY